MSKIIVMSDAGYKKMLLRKRLTSGKYFSPKIKKRGGYKQGSTSFSILSHWVFESVLEG